MRLIFLILTLLFSLTQCQEKKSPKECKQILRLNFPEDPSSFDPRKVRRLKDLTLMKHLFEGLTRLDEKGIPCPAIAETIEVSEDLLTYTFKLRKSTWTDGSEVTSFDFANAWKEVLNPTFPSDYAHILYPIKNSQLAKIGKCPIESVGILTPDKGTLIVTLEHPTSYFLELTAFPTYFPVHPHSTDSHVISNGPFCLKSFQPQDLIILEKNPLYWDAGAVILENILFYLIPDCTTEHYLYEKNELDWLGQPISNALTSSFLEALKSEKKLTSCQIAGTFWFQFNLEKVPFDQKKLRQAFFYALNRQEIIDHVLLGNQVAANSLLPPSLSFKKGDEPYNLEKARGLFQEVCQENNWDLLTFPTITLTYAANERGHKIAQLAQQQWQNAFNIPLLLEAIESSCYRAKLKEGSFQIGTGDWIADFHDPLAFLEIFQYSPKDGSGLNTTRWENPNYSALIRKGSLALEKEERNRYFAEGELLLLEEVPLIPVYYYSFDYQKKEMVQNIFFSPLGIIDFKKAYLTPY